MKYLMFVYDFSIKEIIQDDTLVNVGNMTSRNTAEGAADLSIQVIDRDNRSLGKSTMEAPIRRKSFSLSGGKRRGQAPFCPFGGGFEFFPLKSTEGRFSLTRVIVIWIGCQSCETSETSDVESVLFYGLNSGLWECFVVWAFMKSPELILTENNLNNKFIFIFYFYF